LAADFFCDFKVGPIYSLGPVQRPTRLYVSDEGEPGQWESVIRAHWGGGPLGALLKLGRPGVRRMFDSDGSATGELYLDDLQAHHTMQHALELRPAGVEAEIMCLTVFVDTGLRTVITRHPEFPVEHVDVSRMPSIQFAVESGGVWGLRWAAGSLVSALWISECRWRGDPERAQAVVASIGESQQWKDSASLLGRQGFCAYADAIEFGVDGSIMATLGALDLPGLGQA
jgi:hypothetical protein